jgi:hypothetical protein
MQNKTWWHCSFTSSVISLDQNDILQAVQVEHGDPMFLCSHRGIINMSKETWEGLEDKQYDKIMAKELWIPENEAKFRESQRIIQDDFDED